MARRNGADVGQYLSPTESWALNGPQFRDGGSILQGRQPITRTSQCQPLHQWSFLIDVLLGLAVRGQPVMTAKESGPAPLITTTNAQQTPARRRRRAAKLTPRARGLKPKRPTPNHDHFSGLDRTRPTLRETMTVQLGKPMQKRAGNASTGCTTELRPCSPTVSRPPAFRREQIALSDPGRLGFGPTTSSLTHSPPKTHRSHYWLATPLATAMWATRTSSSELGPRTGNPANRVLTHTVGSHPWVNPTHDVWCEWCGLPKVPRAYCR